VVERGESVDLGSPTLTNPALLFQHNNKKKNVAGPLKWEESAAILREEEDTVRE